MAILWFTTFFLYVCSLLPWIASPQSSLEITSPSSCFLTASNLVSLVSCLDTFTIPHAYYDTLTYDLAQPVGHERDGWKAAIQSILHSNGDCDESMVPLSIRGLYNIGPFQEFCVLYETASRCGTYLKGWGLFIVPSPRAGLRNVHISAPHPGYDLGTVEQAAAVFEATSARSLLIPGRKRTAFLSYSECIIPSSPKEGYYKTDTAHNDQEPFFDANVAISDWQHLQPNGCPSESCVFLQFHGKGATTCPSDDVFLSSGLGNSTASQAWYMDPIDRPIKRLQQNLKRSMPPSWRISMPSSSTCPLTATKNVVGRHLNGVHLPQVCNRAANSRIATGEFVHAEQASRARMKEWYGLWVKAVKETFPVVCDGPDIRHVSGLYVRPAVGDTLGVADTTEGNEGNRLDHDELGLHSSRWYVLLSHLANL